MALYHLHDVEEYVNLQNRELPMRVGDFQCGDLIDCVLSVSAGHRFGMLRVSVSGGAVSYRRRSRFARNEQMGDFAGADDESNGIESP